jgi:hypothetical protein
VKQILIVLILQIEIDDDEARITTDTIRNAQLSVVAILPVPVEVRPKSALSFITYLVSLLLQYDSSLASFFGNQSPCSSLFASTTTATLATKTNTKINGNTID